MEIISKTKLGDGFIVTYVEQDKRATKRMTLAQVNELEARLNPTATPTVGDGYLVVDMKSLESALKRIARVTPKKTSFKAFEYCLIEARHSRDGEISLAATDSDIFLRVRVKSDVQWPVSFAVNPNQALTALKALKSGKNAQVRLSLSGDKAVAQNPATGLKVELDTLSHEGLGHLQDALNDSSRKNGPCRASIEPAELNEAMGVVTHAVSHKSVRYYLNGVHLLERGGRLLFESTDGHRAARYQSGVEIASEFDVIVRDSMAKAWAGQGGKTPHELYLSQKTLFINGEDFTLWGSPIDGRFPDIDSVIPRADGAEYWVRFDPAVMRPGVAALIASKVKCVVPESERYYNRYGFVPSGEKKIGMPMIDAEVRGEIASTHGLNPEYLADALAALGGRDTAILYGPCSDNVAFRIDSGPATLLIMQMRP
jgi:DNA polymerase III sliding clamp (beta) subunit (PCNA family)